MANYPVQAKGASRNAAQWFYMPKKQIAYYKTGRTPNIQFFGLTEQVGASSDNIRDLAEAIHEAINHAARYCGLKKIHHGLSLNPSRAISGSDTVGDYVLWKFPVFATDKDRATIFVKVYTDKVHGGSCVNWCDGLLMSDLASCGQFETMLNAAVQCGITESKRYLLRSNM